MNGVLGHNSTQKSYTGSGLTWADEMNFGMNNETGAISIARLVDLVQCTTTVPWLLPKMRENNDN